MNRKEAVHQAMASMRIEGFTYIQEEEELFRRLGDGEISHADFYRTVNDKIERFGGTRVKIAITTCGHNPNVSNKKKLPAVGQVITCPFCKNKTEVVDIVT